MLKFFTDRKLILPVFLIQLRKWSWLTRPFERVLFSVNIEMSERWPESKNVPKLQFRLQMIHRRWKSFWILRKNLKPSKKNDEAIKQHEEELAKKFNMFKAKKGDVFDQLEKELCY